MQLSDNPITPVLRKKAMAIREYSLESLIRKKNRKSSLIFSLDDLKIDLTRNYITEDILKDLLIYLVRFLDYFYCLQFF